MKIERPIHFTCHCCGECCRWPGHVLLTSDDIHMLARQLNMSEENFIAKHTELARNRRQLSLRERPDGACEFLGEASACRVYPARPAQCRDFPHGWRVEGCPACEQEKTAADGVGQRGRPSTVDG